MFIHSIVCIAALFGGQAPAPSAAPTPVKDKNAARRYAAGLADLTGKYLKEVEKKVTAERGAYDAQAQVFAASEKRGTIDDLAFARDAGAIQGAAQLGDGRMSVADFLSTQVAATATAEFEKTRDLYGQELEHYKTSIKGLADLTVETKKIAALQAAFQTLSKKPGLGEWLASLTQFGSEVDKQIKKSDCALSISRAGYFDSESKRLSGLITAETDATKKTQFQQQKKNADDQLKTLNDRRDATGAYDESKKDCSK